MDQRPSIVIVGGGAAGLHAARALRGLDEFIRVTVVEPTGHHPFLTRLAAVAGGVMAERFAAVPLRELTNAAIITDYATAVRPGSVLLRSGDVLAADAVLIAAGAESTQPPIDGIRNAIPLRSAADAIDIRQRSRHTDSVVIIGGGATGCQLAGALAAGPFEVFVTLIERNGHLMDGFHPAMGQRAFEILTSRGVSVWTGRNVQSIEPDGVRTSGGLATGLPIWAAGFAASGTSLIEAAAHEGRLIVDEYGQVPGHDGIFAAGDIAAHPSASEAHDGFHPMSAQIATKAGRGIGFNIFRTLMGHDPDALELSDLGWVVDLSGNQGVADILGLPLTVPGVDRLVPLLHDAIDLRNVLQIAGLRGVFGGGSSAPMVVEERGGVHR